MQKDHAGLTELAGRRLQHRRLAHLIDACPPIGVTGGAMHEVDEDRLPIEPGTGEIEGNLIGITGLAETMQLQLGVVLGHGAPPSGLITALTQQGVLAWCCGQRVAEACRLAVWVCSVRPSRAPPWVRRPPAFPVWHG